MRSKSMKRNKVSAEVWEQARIAFVSGSIGLRELARKMGIPQGTMTARAWREGWTKTSESVKQLSEGEQSLAVKPTVLQSVAATMQARAERHVERMAGVTDKVLPHLESINQPKFSTARTTSSDSTTLRGGITEWRTNPLRVD